MSSNFLPPPDMNQNNNQPPAKRRGGLLSGGYTSQPGNNGSSADRPPTGNPPSLPMPPGGPGWSGPGPQSQLPPPAQPPQQWRGPAFMAGPAQMVQRLSNKMAALRRPGPPVDPNPLVRYHAPQPPMSQPNKPVVTRKEPWHLSRTHKINRLIRKRQERQYRYGVNPRKIWTIAGSIIAALLVVIVASGGISSYAYYQSQLPQLQGLANMTVPQSTHIYDRNGVLLYTLYNGQYGRSTPVSYNEIPGYMQDAQIAAEDKNFWTDNGVDPVAIVRSAFTDASSGAAETGASTITQQVVRNLDHQTAPNLQRKISEAALAIGMTQEYPKWKILEMYFNIAPYGTQEQGIEAAAQDFFGLNQKCGTNFSSCIPAVAYLDRDNTSSKCTSTFTTYNGVAYADDDSTCPIDPVLGLARASLLASIPQNPPSLDPTTNYANYSALLTRQDYVLNQMMTDGMSINLGLGSQTDKVDPITPAIIQQAEALTKKMQFKGFDTTEKAPHFVNWIISTLADQMGDGDYSTGLQILEDSGLNIRTTLDYNLEEYVEAAVKRHVTQPEYQPFLGCTETLDVKPPSAYQYCEGANLHDSAAIVMDAKTGEILAMDGSVDWNDTSQAGSGQTNMAIEPRQPGSSFKPIVLAAAYEQGFYPGIILPDQKTYFYTGENTANAVSSSNTYIPTDYGQTYSGRNTNIEFAISNSYNIPALKMEYYVGEQAVYNMATRLGITSISDVQGAANGLNPSMALGTDPVSLLEMTGVYQTFANGGVRVAPQGILNIWDNYGRELYQYTPNGTRVLSQQIAFLISSTLDNAQDRTAEFENDHVLDLTDDDWVLPDGSYPQVAAKTGTTGTGTIQDNWTLGYTPDVVVGVWSGNADESPMLDSIGVTGAAPIWHSIMTYVNGHCEKDNPVYHDGISCPPLDLHYNDLTFVPPSGVVQQSVSTVNGLAGSGYTSYMLQNEIPSQTGLSCSSSSNSTSTPTPSNDTGTDTGTCGNGGSDSTPTPTP